MAVRPVAMLAHASTDWKCIAGTVKLALSKPPPVVDRLASLQSCLTVYLLPEYEDPSAQHEMPEEFWPRLFEAMLGGWVTNEALWPKNRTFEMFREWFEVQMSSIVQDLDLAERLEYAE